MEITNYERTILAIKQEANHNKPGLGLIRPIAELVNGSMESLTLDNFCHSGMVFVNSRYDEIDEKFRTGELFRVSIGYNVNISSTTNNPSKYITQDNRAEKLQQSELAEVIEAELPDKNDRKIYDIKIPATVYIFVRNRVGECFGPFAWKDNSAGQTEIAIEFITGGGLGKAGSTKQVHKIEKKIADNEITSCQIVNRTHHFVANIPNLIRASHLEDYASDTEMIDYVQKIASEGGNRLIEREAFQQFASLISKNPKNNNQLVKNRLARFSDLSTEAFGMQCEIQNGMDAYLKSESGKKVLESYVQEHRVLYLDQLKKEGEIKTDGTLSRKHEDILLAIGLDEDRQKEKRDELTKIIDEIERRRKEADQESILARASLEIEEQLSEKRKQCSEAEEQLKIFVKHNDKYVKPEGIQQENILTYTQEKTTEAKKTLQELEKETAQGDDNLRTKLMTMKQYVDAINGSFSSGDIELPSLSIRTSAVELAGDISQQQRTVIEAIQQHLNYKGRSMEAWQVANLLICTQQSFITFMAGLPGVGKTSLSRLLAKVQGLTPRLQEVSVARGWTSLKDMVGFHNPLANRFQSANTGLYQFLMALDDELNGEKLPAMSYILLDEANLSPIEHYWSAFMTMSDGEANLALRLGQKSLRIPQHLRFLATINYDGTTEPLSPRVVDRAPILVMEANSIVDLGTRPNLPSLELPLSAEKMNSLFGLAGKTPNFEDLEATAFDDIRDVLAKVSDKGRPISISQRKTVAIRQYCGRARSIMSPDGETLALDLAVLQHVLPQVRGHGPKFAERLKELKKILDSYQLIKSTAYLERMIAYGETDLHSYDFFCW